MLRPLFSLVLIFGIVAAVTAADKGAKRKVAPIPLREEPLDMTEAAAIADLPLGICIWSEELFNLVRPYLRKGDHLVVGTSQLAIMDRIPEGVYKVLFLPRQHSLIDTAEYQKAIARADALSMDDTPSVEQAKWLRQMADKYQKKALINPTGEEVQRVGDQMAPYGDIFKIQAQRWLVEDASRDLKPFCDKVHRVAESLRQANPKLQIWVQLGRKVQYGGSNAGVLVHGFAKLRASHPEDVIHGQIFIEKAPDTQPGHGKQALVEFLQAVRPKP